MQNNKFNKYQYMNKRSNEIIQNINKLKLVQNTLISQNEKIQNKIDKFPTKDKRIIDLKNKIISIDLILITTEIIVMLISNNLNDLNIILGQKNITIFVINFTSLIFAKDISKIIINSNIFQKDYGEEELIKLTTSLIRNQERIKQINNEIKKELKTGFSLEKEAQVEFEKQNNYEKTNNINHIQNNNKTLKLTRNLKK